MNTKSVQVVMSTYNGEKYLKEQIDSILSQEGVDVRLYIRDDGSSDRTTDILASYQEHKNVKIEKGNNLGFAKSFLTALDECDEADYYAFSDQDDVWEKDKLSTAMYFKLFLTTRNGLFQSLAFVSIGMQIAEAEQFDKLRVSIQNAIVFVLVCAVKVFCSLFGGSDISKLLDLPTFYFMFAVIILECKENRLKGNFYKHLRSTSETMYFIHMYFVAFCALVLYKDDYNNFKSYLICAGGALAVSEIYSWMKNISNRSTTVSRLKHD